MKQLQPETEVPFSPNEENWAVSIILGPKIHLPFSTNVLRSLKSWELGAWWRHEVCRGFWGVCVGGDASSINLSVLCKMK